MITCFKKPLCKFIIMDDLSIAKTKKNVYS